MPSRRLKRLRSTEVCGTVVPVARGVRARLLGLALLDRDQAGKGLFIPRCSSVHTFGMRFSLLVVFLDDADSPLSLRIVAPRRFARQGGAAAVLELPFPASSR